MSKPGGQWPACPQGVRGMEMTVYRATRACASVPASARPPSEPARRPCRVSGKRDASFHSARPSRNQGDAHPSHEAGSASARLCPEMLPPTESTPREATCGFLKGDPSLWRGSHGDPGSAGLGPAPLAAHRACMFVKSSLRGYNSQTLTCTTLSGQRSESPHHSGQGAGRFQVPGTPGAPRGLRCLQMTAVRLKGTPARPSVPGESERWVQSVCSHCRTAAPQAVGDGRRLVSALIPKGASNLLACD